MPGKPHSADESDEDTIWRYTTLAKFLNVLRRSDAPGEGELIAKRSDKLEDEYEGTLSSPTEQTIREEVMQFFTNKGLADHDPEDILASPDKMGVDEYPEWTARSAADSVIESHQRARELTFLNCWRLDEYESSNMWKAYTSKTDGVAIRSSIDALKEAALNKKDEIHIREVSYMDYSIKEMFTDGFLDPFFHKRKEFADESEVRIAVTDIPYLDGQSIGYGADALPEPSDSHIRAVPYDMTELVNEVRVHPQAGSYMTDIVEKALTKFNLDVPVNDSSLRS